MTPRAMLALLVVGVALIGLWLSRLDHPVQPEANASRLDTVADGVSMAGRDLSHWRGDQLRDLFVEISRDFGSPPADARIDRVNQSLIPERNGLKIDVDRSIKAVLDAPEGARVSPELVQVTPSVKLSDLPPMPLRSGNPGKRAVTLMINVAWGNEYLPAILESLAKEDVRASFFLMGKWAEDYPGLALQIAEQGHEIDNHGYDSVGMASLSASAQSQQINRANEAIQKATGRTPLYFSPHRGEYNTSLLELTRSNGQQTILWSMDTVDWKDPGAPWILRRVERLLHPGGLILMHPTASASSALEDVIRLVQGNGYRLITLQDMLSPDPLR